MYTHTHTHLYIHNNFYGNLLTLVLPKPIDFNITIMYYYTLIY